MSEPMSVQILEREYLVACTPDERPGLAAAASMLDAKMREIRAGSRTATLDRIAVMAALNLAHELLELRRSATEVDASVGGELDALKTRLDAMLAAHAR